MYISYKHKLFSINKIIHTGIDSLAPKWWWGEEYVHHTTSKVLHRTLGCWARIYLGV